MDGRPLIGRSTEALWQAVGRFVTTNACPCSGPRVPRRSGRSSVERLNSGQFGISMGEFELVCVAVVDEVLVRQPVDGASLGSSVPERVPRRE
jgi:hypothetical protein